jgi:hypothetical protein
MGAAAEQTLDRGRGVLHPAWISRPSPRIEDISVILFVRRGLLTEVIFSLPDLALTLTNAEIGRLIQCYPCVNCSFFRHGPVGIDLRAAQPTTKVHGLMSTQACVRVIAGHSQLHLPPHLK